MFSKKEEEEKLACGFYENDAHYVANYKKY